MVKSVLATAIVSAMFLMSMSPGDVAPEFSAKNQNGDVVHLSDYKGKFVVMYFYPKDETPGCTKEACSFRDAYSKIKALNAVVLGVSRQDEKSHQEFITHHKLPFSLLVDEDGKIAEKYGVGKMPVIGLLKRESVLIGPDGKVVKFYESVNPEKHVDEVVTDIRAAQKSS